MNISEILKTRRLKLNISQADLANRLGFKHRSSISRLEACKIEWKFRDVIKACEILEVDINLTNR